MFIPILDLYCLEIIVERVSGQPLDVFVEENIYKPLGMIDTYYNPEK